MAGLTKEHKELCKTCKHAKAAHKGPPGSIRAGKKACRMKWCQCNAFEG